MATTSIPIIDSDSHLTEPPDLWTARLPQKWHDLAPRVELREETGYEHWRIGKGWGPRVGACSTAGKYYLPECPATFDEIEPATYDAHERLKWMDANGIQAQVLYSNVLAFEGHAFLALDDEELRNACVRAYNDYVAEFATVAPDRFVLTVNLPFWNLEETEREIKRCIGLGYKGILWAATFEKHGLPGHLDRHWDPVYALAQDAGLSINFHVGVGKTEEEINLPHMRGGDFDLAANTQRSAMGWMSNAMTVAGLITSGLCDRFPRLNFVSVESGFGYFPFLIESLDWQWRGAAADKRYENRLMPSEYFRRQIYTSFWFEHASLSQLASMPDNVMFETDFPHSTSLTPGPKSQAEAPNQIAGRLVEEFGADLMRKVLHDNAARVYHL